MDIVKLETERLAWSLATFPEATPVSSLRKLEEEIKEIETDIKAGIRVPEEYADALMCLFDSAGRFGISVVQIIEAFAVKLQKNKSRTWTKKPDNTYSHVKKGDEHKGPLVVRFSSGMEAFNVVHVHSIKMSGDDEFARRMNYVHWLFMKAGEEEKAGTETDYQEEYFQAKICLEQGYPMSFLIEYEP